jgi:hypothetical protein
VHGFPKAGKCKPCQQGRGSILVMSSTDNVTGRNRIAQASPLASPGQAAGLPGSKTNARCPPTHVTHDVTSALGLKLCLAPRGTKKESVQLVHVRPAAGSGGRVTSNRGDIPRGRPRVQPARRGAAGKLAQQPGPGRRRRQLEKAASRRPGWGPVPHLETLFLGPIAIYFDTTTGFFFFFLSSQQRSHIRK